MAAHQAYFTIWCIMVLQFISLVSCGGEFEMYMIKYDNSYGKQSDGDNCDPFGGDCDHYFQICLLGIWCGTTGIYWDQNIVVFGSNMGGIANPIVQRFNSFPAIINLQVIVTDRDDTYHDPVDSFADPIRVVAHPSEATSLWTSEAFYGGRSSYKTRLEVKYRAYCNSYYYGSTCSTYCVPSGGCTCSSAGTLVCVSTPKSSTNTSLGIEGASSTVSTNVYITIVAIVIPISVVVPSVIAGFICYYRHR